MAITDRRTGSVVDIAYLTSAPSDLDAPTVAEITAGTRLECYVTDSFETPRSGSTAEISGLCTREMFHIPATIDNGNVSIPMWREFDGTDAAWALADDTTVPPATAYLVVCRAGFSGASGAPATGDTVDTYTVQIVSREPAGPSKTEGQQFVAQWAVQALNPDGTVG